jgi:hypothetical protein
MAAPGGGHRRQLAGRGRAVPPLGGGGRFVAGRLRWEQVGALFSDRELDELRLLNAAHSSSAYLSALAGIMFVDEAMARPGLAGFLRRLLYTEAVPTSWGSHATPPQRGDGPERSARNDGTREMATFLVPTVADQLAAGGPLEGSARPSRRGLDTC